MSEIEKIRNQFELYAASKYDFEQACFCARYLIKKGWHSEPWERRGTIYAQQTAFVTNLVIAYARPFTKSQGWGIFPKKFGNFDNNQNKMHNKLIEMRNEIFAHSDKKHFSFEPHEDDIMRALSEKVPSRVVSAVEARLVELMTSQLLEVTNKEIEKLNLRLLDIKHKQLSSC